LSNKAGFYFAFIPTLLYNLRVELKIFLLFMPLDEQLIALGNRGAKVAENSESNLVDSDNEENNSAIKAGEFRESVKGKEANYNKEGSEYNQDEKGDFRSSRREAVRQRAGENLKNEVKEKTGAPIKKATSQLLKAAWKSLISSWGLSLIWINIHVFLGQVFGKNLFCSLGEEWLSEEASKNSAGAKKSVGLVEKMGVCCLDLGCLFLIIALLSLVAMIVSGITNPLKAIKALFGTLWCAIIGGCNKGNTNDPEMISLLETILDTYL
jgi:hypothetical protein